MDNQATPAAKVCRVCNQDVSKKPRQKDAQGRYVCQECLDKSDAKRTGGQSRRGAGAASTAGSGTEVDPGLAAALAGVDQGAMAPCPGCGTLLKPDAALCTNCGFDVGKGKSIRTRFSVEKGAKEKGDFKLPISWEIVAGIMVFLIVASGVLATFVPAGVMVFLSALMFCCFLIWLMLVVTPFQDGNSGWGLYNLLGPLIGPLLIMGNRPCTGLLLFFAYPIVEIYYIFAVNWRPSLRRLFIAGAIGGVMLSILMAMHGHERIISSLGMDPKDFEVGEKNAPVEPGEDLGDEADVAPAPDGSQSPPV